MLKFKQSMKSLFIALCMIISVLAMSIFAIPTKTASAASKNYIDSFGFSGKDVATYADHTITVTDNKGDFWFYNGGDALEADTEYVLSMTVNKTAGEGSYIAYVGDWTKHTNWSSESNLSITFKGSEALVDGTNFKIGFQISANATLTISNIKIEGPAEPVMLDFALFNFATLGNAKGEWVVDENTADFKVENGILSANTTYNNNNYPLRLYQTGVLSLVENETYKVSVTYKSPDVNLHFFFNDDPAYYATSDHIGGASAADWVTLSMEFVPKYTGYFKGLNIQTWSGSGSFEIKDFYIAKASESKTLNENDTIGTLPTIAEKQYYAGTWTIDGAAINAETTFTYTENKVAYVTYTETQHVGVKQNGQAATCTENGWEDYYECGNCGGLFADEACENTISDLATWKTTAEQGLIVASHDFDTEKWATDGNNHWHACKNCDATKDNGAHEGGTATCASKAVCATCGSEYGEVLAHSFTNYVSDNNATCEADGTKTATCDNCDATDTVADAGSKKTHSYSTEWSKNDTHHWHECACGDKADEAEHVYGDWRITKEATESEAGTKERECECGEKQVETIEKLNPTTSSESDNEASLFGCASVIGLGTSVGSILGVAALMVIKKKKED